MRIRPDSWTFVSHVGLLALAMGLASHAFNLDLGDWWTIITRTERRMLGHGEVYRQLPLRAQGLVFSLTLLAGLFIGSRAFDRIRASFRVARTGRQPANGLPASIVLAFVIATAYVHAGCDWIKPEIDNCYRVYSGIQQKKACLSNMKCIAGAIELYQMDRNGPERLPDLETLEKEEYLRTMPRCPSGGRYVLTLAADSGRADVHCLHHGALEGLERGDCF